MSVQKEVKLEGDKYCYELFNCPPELKFPSQQLHAGVVLLMNILDQKRVSLKMAPPPVDVENGYKINQAPRSRDEYEANFSKAMSVREKILADRVAGVQSVIAAIGTERDAFLSAEDKLIKSRAKVIYSNKTTANSPEGVAFNKERDAFNKERAVHNQAKASNSDNANRLIKNMGKLSAPIGKGEFRHKIFDPVIDQFEQHYHTSRSTVLKVPFLSDLQAAFDRLLGSIEISVEFPKAEKNSAMIMFRYMAQSVKAATIYFGDERFTEKSQPDDSAGLRQIYDYKGRDYVKDRNNIFVKRFVYRNLADYDVKNFADFKKDGIAARNPNGHANENRVALRREVMKHLRSAADRVDKSYFISATTTKRPIFGSTGTNFYSPKFGQIIIDLAKIKQDSIVDVHSIGGLKAAVGATHLTWGEQFVEGENGPGYEENAAARDTVRTREILIVGKVPAAAIVALRKEDVGDGSWYTIDGKFIPPGLIPQDVYIDPPAPQAGRKPV